MTLLRRLFYGRSYSLPHDKHLQDFVLRKKIGREQEERIVARRNAINALTELVDCEYKAVADCNSCGRRHRDYSHYFTGYGEDYVYRCMYSNPPKRDIKKYTEADTEIKNARVVSRAFMDEIRLIREILKLPDYVPVDTLIGADLNEFLDECEVIANGTN